jgi:hypothetical protein
MSHIKFMPNSLTKSNSAKLILVNSQDQNNTSEEVRTRFYLIARNFLVEIKFVCLFFLLSKEKQCTRRKTCKQIKKSNLPYRLFENGTNRHKK